MGIKKQFIGDEIGLGKDSLMKDVDVVRGLVRFYPKEFDIIREFWGEGLK